ncbi:MAG: hypothetical protein FJ147_21780 [Deltaproteobacteria bacterium]|nr:hypothetical protein [Deltaproteobacteria bacterium]
MHRNKTVLFCIATLFILALNNDASAHGDGNGGGKSLVKIAFTPNPNVPEFANAKGIVQVDLKKGVIEIEALTRFPFNTVRNRILPVDVTSTIDPRLKGHDGEPGGTSCHAAEGKWSCHVHSYVVWLAELEDGALGHPIPLGTIYPRTDGTTAERSFTLREGDLSGFGMNVVIITAEVTFGPLPSITHGHDGGESEVQLVPRGPVVMQANLP